MIEYVGKRLILNRGLFVSCACILFARIAQTISIVGENGFPIECDALFVGFNNMYVGLFILAPCLICSMQPIGNLVSNEKVIIRLKDKDSCVLRYARLLITSAIICSAWMSLVTFLSFAVVCGNIAITANFTFLLLENSILQMVFSVTCSCLFLVLNILSGNAAIASIGVFLYAAVDMITSGIPQLAGWFPALSWAIVQIAKPYDVVPLVTRAVFPLLLSALCSAISILEYRRGEIMGSKGSHHEW